MRPRIRGVLIVTAGTFVLSVMMNLSSTSLLRFLTLWPSIVLLAFIVFIGIMFDIVGVAATAASEVPFHAMAVDKVPGSYQSIWMVRNADKVGTFCNDVIGDIAGTLSGAVASAIVFALIRSGGNLSEFVLQTFVVAAAAAATVGGKSYGKSIAINNANDIIHIVGRFLFAIESLTGLKLVRLGNNRSRSQAGGKRRKQRGKEGKK